MAFYVSMLTYSQTGWCEATQATRNAVLKHAFEKLICFLVISLRVEIKKSHCCMLISSTRHHKQNAGWKLLGPFVVYSLEIFKSF